MDAPQAAGRPRVDGKFLYSGDKKLYIRGVTYGPFRPDEAGNVYHRPDMVEQDFAQMASHNINAIRTYHVPPDWMMDAAQRHGLYVMVGLPWESHVAFFDYKQGKGEIEQRVLTSVRACGDHPALLCFTIANEVPASIVRWYGRRRIERYLHQLYQLIKNEQPKTLVTYVNYPTTEYLQLPFLDFFCYNVYLESQDRLEAYMARLQNLCGEKPLLMGELGLDSLSNGEEAQAVSLDWQIRTAFDAGCAGAFIFAWTDEWFNGGREMDEEWAFGLTRRDRSPKPVLAAVGRAYADVPFGRVREWPRFSVVVCTNNGSETIQDCCEGLQQLCYPEYEVIVVDDGSTDGSAKIAGDYGFQVISTENRGLASARNTGLAAAAGEIVAYLDDDARPDPNWLHYLATTFAQDDFTGVGGPNVGPSGDGPIADCIAQTPGNPTHVLVTDTEAEHIPGCNMAFRKDALQAIDGFDTQFRIAGDDIDICWRLQEQGWQLGFSPSAMVWHHRRKSVKAFLKQQLNYGRAEGLLEHKWPEKYNGMGQLHWHGRLYGTGLENTRLFKRWHVYYGVWGSRFFQSIYETGPGTFGSFMLAPEWFLVIVLLGSLTLMGLLWAPLLLALPLLILAAGPPIVYAAIRGWKATFPTYQTGGWKRPALHALVALLHLLLPLARLAGRLAAGLTPWRRRGLSNYALPRPRSLSMWREKYQTPEARFERLESIYHERGAVVLRGGQFDRWDLEIRGGLLGGLRILMAS
ncbi:MAG: glycosyltransferase, partial [Chloroflexota bacterium]